ncbi:MAG: hypothetical protein FWD74_07505 [Actinomycetia bacterium]|nr:hypothetical protein [Actinomycetes bacterium]
MDDTQNIALSAYSLMSSCDVSDFLGVSRMTVSRWARMGALVPLMRAGANARAPMVFARADVIALNSRLVRTEQVRLP